MTPLTPRSPKWLWGPVAVLAPTLALIVMIAVLAVIVPESLGIAVFIGQYALLLGPIGAAVVLLTAYGQGRRKVVTAESLKRMGVAAFMAAVIILPIIALARALIFTSNRPALKFDELAGAAPILAIILITAAILGVPVAVAHYVSLLKLAFHGRTRGG